MLLSLEIHDFVLIDKAVVPFERGLNVLTGETGSGKSALIDALNLVLGARSDVSLIRHGQEKAVIEALFDITHLSSIPPLLEKMGISSDSTILHIKRELSKEGKGRIWINRESAPLASLKALSLLLIEFVGQRASKDLIELENHLNILDEILGLIPLRESFKDAHLSQLKKEKELRYLEENTQELIKKRREWAQDLQEIELIAPKDQEEESLFEEYSLLINTEELKEGLLSILSALNEEGILQALSLVKKKAEALQKIDKSIQNAYPMIIEAIAEMKEVERFIEQKLSTIEENPHRLHAVEERLKILSRLKKQFGPTMEDVFSTWKKLKRESMQSDTLDQTDKLKEEISIFKKRADNLALKLQEKRRILSKEFSQKVTSILKTLNMPNALFTVSVQEKARSEIGDDHIEFFLSPNLGESLVSLSNAASGGELSRVLLALKLLDTGNVASFVFDEVDAHIGGNTAALVGEKLKSLSVKKQVILITHFPQVARFACHHIKISKKEVMGRTYTEIAPLIKEEREKEILRMLGMTSL